jgi:hypothetical protein
MKEGWKAISGKRGMMVLIVTTSVICLFMGVFQVLGESFVLAFADAKTLGIVETVAASGMLVTSVILGFKGIKKNYQRTLGIGLAVSGVGMTMFALTQNVYIICIFGFIFFAALPFANNSLDYLIRANIPAELQGRAWGFAGFISQLGYVIAYALCGVVADVIGNATGKGVGAGSSITIIGSGICLAVVAVLMSGFRQIKALEASAASSAQSETAQEAQAPV